MARSLSLLFSSLCALLVLASPLGASAQQLEVGTEVPVGDDAISLSGSAGEGTVGVGASAPLGDTRLELDLRFDAELYALDALSRTVTTLYVVGGVMIAGSVGLGIGAWALDESCAAPMNCDAHDAGTIAMGVGSGIFGLAGLVVMSVGIGLDVAVGHRRTRWGERRAAHGEPTEGVGPTRIRVRGTGDGVQLGLEGSF
jgi:hypothetical protein